MGVSKAGDGGLQGGRKWLSLQDIFQVGCFCADSKIVQDGITILVLELGGSPFCLDSLSDGVQVFVASTTRTRVGLHGGKKA